MNEFGVVTGLRATGMDLPRRVRCVVGLTYVEPREQC